MNWILSLVGPMLIRLISSTVVKAVAREAVNAVIDKVEIRLQAEGFHAAAEMLDKIQKELLGEIEAAKVEPTGPNTPRIGGGALLSRIIDRLKSNPPADQR